MSKYQKIQLIPPHNLLQELKIVVVKNRGVSSSLVIEPETQS